MPRIESVTTRDLVPLFRLETLSPTPFVLEPRLLRAIGYG
jgi:hypothetical protein